MFDDKLTAVVDATELVDAVVVGDPDSDDPIDGEPGTRVSLLAAALIGLQPAMRASHDVVVDRPESLPEGMRSEPPPLPNTP